MIIVNTRARLAAALIFGFALSGCGEQSAAEKVVRENLKDPDSARFGEFYYNEATDRACFTVNAKNSMGGYTGDKQVQLAKHDGEWVWVSDMDDAGPDECRKLYADAHD